MKDDQKLKMPLSSCPRSNYIGLAPVETCNGSGPETRHCQMCDHLAHDKNVDYYCNHPDIADMPDVKQWLSDAKSSGLVSDYGLVDWISAKKLGPCPGYESVEKS